MSAASHYQITVSHNGRHYFSTSSHHGHFLNEVGAKQLLIDIRKRFPLEEGYEVTMTYWECVGHRHPH